jgi:tripartite-type tricarboxylate transporter receptor subunit TctC
VLPDVPTMEESGYHGFDVGSVAGLAAPAGTPPAVVARLNEAVQKAAQESAVKRRLTELGYDIAVGTSADFANKIAADTQKYEKLIPELGLSPK